MSGMVVEKLFFGYGARPILKGVSFSHDAGVMCVLGPNGVGKSTLFRCLLGLNRRYEGRILIEGSDIKDLSERQMAQRCAYVPQSQGTAFGYTVEEMVLMGTSARAGLFPPGKEHREIARVAMRRMGIGQISDRDFTKISGGERQLALIARALAQKSRVMIMDEPTANLDYGNQMRILKEIRALADQGLCVLLSTHHPDHAFLYADRVLALKDGQVCALGSPNEVIDAALIERLYGAKVRIEQTNDGRRMTIPIGIYPPGAADEIHRTEENQTW